MHGSPALFAASALLMALISWIAARRFARTPADSYWVFLAAAAAHLGVVGTLTSLFHAYAPIPYLVTQAVVCALAAAFFWHWRRGRRAVLIAELRSWRSHAGARALLSDPLAGAMALALVILLAASAAEQLLVPVAGVDERAYNCSRVLYWMQFRSFFPFESHNDGQMDMPFGAELWFGWAVLFTRDEAIGRAVFWLGFPVSVAGTYLLVRRIGGGIRTGLVAALLFAATPTVLFHAGLSQKQDLWTAAYSIGTAFWTAKAARRAGWRPLFWAALYLALAMNARITSVAMVPVLGLAAVLDGRFRALPARFAALAAGAAAGLLVSGLAITIGHNFSAYGRPFGSTAMQKVVQPDFSPTQAWTHTVRAVLFLIELPEQPIESVRQWFRDTGTSVIPAVGAAPILPGEEHPLWPGRFVFEARPYANKYALGGILWMAGLVGAAWLVCRRGFRTWPRVRLPGAVWVMALSAASLAEMIYLLRWAGGTWPRYWIAAYAVGLAAAVALTARCVRSRPPPGALVLIAVVAMVYPSIRIMIGRVESAVRNPAAPAQLDDPYESVTPLLEPGSRTLLLCTRGTRDYGLFLPRQGYTAQVFPWGKRQPDTARLGRLIQDHAITHVLFERDDVLGFHWDPVVRTGEMVRWMQSRPEFNEVLLPDPRMRLFERAGAQPRSQVLPAFYGFNALDGLGPIETIPAGDETLQVRWGDGPETTLKFRSKGGRARLVMECRRNNSPDQAVTVKVNGREIASRSFSEPLRFEAIEADFDAAPGDNTVAVGYTHQEGERALTVLYRRLQIVTMPPR